jgi:hypothetical protein
VLGVAQSGPIVSLLPVLLIGILFGLAIDYEVFLVSRMREAYVHSGEARESVVAGYGHSGRVVTAAAVIMARRRRSASGPTISAAATEAGPRWGPGAMSPRPTHAL